MFDRDGHKISQVRMMGTVNAETVLEFSPPILVGGKPATVMNGDTATGKAYVSRSRATIVLADEEHQVLLKTTCT
jgi:hypothetical protein